MAGDSAIEITVGDSGITVTVVETEIVIEFPAEAPESGPAETVPWANVTGKPTTFAPTAHASAHVTGGSDKIRDATSEQDGLMTAAQAAVIAGLGNSSSRNVGTTAGTVAAGDDARLSDARTPTAHTHPPSGLTQGGASVGQTLKWNGTAWAAAASGGIEPLWVPAARWAPGTSNGASANSRDVGSVRVLDSWDFLPGTTRTITVQVGVPASWTGTEISVAIQSSTGSGTAAQFVRWSVSARWMADGDAESAAFGTAQTVDDAIGTVDTWRDSAATPAITPAGTAGQKVISIQLQRLGASDDAPGSARGLGFWINWL